jgi:hypothetical protein
MLFVEDDDMIKAISADGSDQPRIAPASASMPIQLILWQREYQVAEAAGSTVAGDRRSLRAQGGELISLRPGSRR